MAGKRDDYLLRALDQLRQMVAQAVKLRDGGRLEQALFAIIHAQEGLFAQPARAFMGLSLDQQLDLLKIGESAETARGKCIGYARSLNEAGLVYEAKDKPELAFSAFHSAFYILLTTALETPTAADELRPEIENLYRRLPLERMQAPLQELLRQFSH